MQGKRLTALLSAFVLVAAVAILGITAATAGAAQKKGVTITIWDYFDAPPNGTAERNAMLAVANQWAKKTGNKVVDPGYVASKEDKFVQAAPAGQGPDIIMEPHDRIGSFVVPGLLAPEPANLFTKTELADYNSVALSAFNYGGKSYGVPWARETYFLFYNKDLVKTPPTTWGGLIQTAKKLTTGDQYGFLWDTTNFYYDFAFMAGYGGYVFKSTKGGLDPQQLGIDTPGSIKGLKLIQDLTNYYKLTPASTNTDVMEGKFGAGKAAMIIDGPWAVAGFKAKGINFGVAGLPQFQKGSPMKPFIGVQGFLVNSHSKNTAAAWDLVKYLSQHMELSLFKAAGRVPVLNSVANSKLVKANPVTQAVIASSNLGVPMPNIPAMAAVWTPMANALQTLVQGKSTPAQTASDAQKAIQQAIAQQGG
jgi:arabinogalactan oligomer/maltooligosaccharide transport system substrate-binding protein